ncbi:MAG: ATP-binding protein [Victivallaceae bacterium]|nr:ATP-binding protein [Victivallaceae bacterium]
MTIKQGVGYGYDTMMVRAAQFRAGIRRYSAAEQCQLEWLWGYSHDVLGASRHEIERATGLEWAFLYSVFIGKSEVDLAPLMEIIAQLRVQVAQKMPLVDTIVTTRIREALDYARDNSALVTVTGPTGRGKSYTAMHWARLNNHGQTKYLRVPSGATPKSILQLLVDHFGIAKTGCTTQELAQKLMREITPRNVLIFDEAGFLLPSGQTNNCALELVRDIHDQKGCGIALIFTDVYLRDMRNGRRADFFEQFIGRIMFSVEIPDRIFRSEVAEICRSFIPEADDRLVDYAYATAIKRDGKLRVLFEDLRKARAFAESEHRKLTVDDLKAAVVWRKSGGVWPEV